MYRFDGFTEKANNALNLALTSAEDMGHTYIGSEHIILGLLKENSGVAAEVLSKLGVTEEAFTKCMEEKIGTGSRTSLSYPTQQTYFTNCCDGSFQIKSQLRWHRTFVNCSIGGRRQLWCTFP